MAVQVTIKMKPELLGKFNQAKADGYTFTEYSRKFGGRKLVTHYTTTKEGITTPNASSIAVLLTKLNY